MAEFNVLDEIRIIALDQTYPCYCDSDFVESCEFWNMYKWGAYPCIGEYGVIVAKYPHRLINGKFIYIVKTSGSRVFAVNGNGLCYTKKTLLNKLVIQC